ncbi:AAA family ATPase [Vibrio vulnificus]
MLVYFSVENFKSINERIELNLKTAPRLRRLSHHTVAPTSDPSFKVLRNAVIYGANASGKSNIVKAIRYAQNLVTGQRKQRRQLKLEPFKLTNNIRKDTSFCFEFIYNKALFAYGFTLDGEKVKNEYYYHLDDKDNNYCFYERVLNEDNIYDVHTDMFDDVTLPKEELDDLVKLIKYSPNNQLFIHEAHTNDYDVKLTEIGGIFIPALYFFFNQLIVIFPDTFYGALGKDLSSSCSYVDLLSRFDTGVSGLKSEDTNLSLFPKEVLDDVLERLNEDGDFFIVQYRGKEYSFSYENGSVSVSKIVSTHRLIDGTEIKFDLDQESDGTRRLIDLLPALTGSVDESGDEQTFTYIIDEFDRSLHPNLSKEFLNAFLNENLSDCQNQLIVTTHESSLMDTKLLRRDAIWFVQKEEDHSTTLYSLNDYSPRFDKDIRTAYLSGIYGAVPHLETEN